MKTNLYTHLLLTVIAALLAWNTLFKVTPATVHAQSPARYRMVSLMMGESIRSKELSDQVNKAAGNGELVQVVVLEYGNGNAAPYAIFKDR
ncbi:MAG TPA: hypothetical protein VGK29_22965 [Paludibaculum sp.]|jgi:hypothetical protein